MTIVDEIVLLRDPKSSKRRSGAKRLRKRKDISAGPPLLQALKKEVQDSRTWETQYQMIMALGECRYHEGLKYLVELSTKVFDSTMIYTSLGDAIFRLSIVENKKDISLLAEDMVATKNQHILEGSIRALAMLQITPSQKSIEEIIKCVLQKSSEEYSLQFWVAAAAADWKGENVKLFLNECLTSPFEDLRTAAASSLKGKRKKWNPL